MTSLPFSFSEAAYFFLPFSLVMYSMDRVPGYEAFYVFLINFGFAAFVMSWFLFFMGMFSVLTGSTPYEDKHNICTRERNLSLKGRFELVFGSCGLVHFLVPVVPFRPAEVEPGYRMLLGPQFA